MGSLNINTGKRSNSLGLPSNFLNFGNGGTAASLNSFGDTSPFTGSSPDSSNPARSGLFGNGGFLGLGNFFDQAGEDGQVDLGFGGQALDAFGGLANTFLGMKQFGLAKKVLEENRRQFQLNFDNAAKLTNERLETRQQRRVSENPNARSVSSTLSKFGVNQGG